ncbi:MAG: DUF1150 family protein [Pseudomonadota bacterium]
MDTKFRFPQEIEDRTVYVRPMDSDDLPEELRAQVGPGKQIYAIHDGDGDCLALALDRSAAFAIARVNEMAPVSVH